MSDHFLSKTNSVMKNAYAKKEFLCTIEELLYVPKY